MLKAVRNAAASAAAWTLYHAPALEGPYAYAAHAALGVPGVHTLFRETTDRLVTRLAQENRAARRMRIGSVSPVFDVSSFTVKGRYFARVTYEPGATGAVFSSLGDGDVFVDIGANSGYFTVLAALRVGARGASSPSSRTPRSRRSARNVTSSSTDCGPRHRVGACALADEDRDDVRLFVSCWPENDGIASLTPAAETLARGGLRADACGPRSRPDVRHLDAVGPAAADRLDEDQMSKVQRRRVLSGMSATFAWPPSRSGSSARRLLSSEAVKILRDRATASSTLDEIPGGIPNLLFEYTMPC